MRRNAPALAIAVVALIVSLGGTGTAATDDGVGKIVRITGKSQHDEAKHAFSVATCPRGMVLTGGGFQARNGDSVNAAKPRGNTFVVAAPDHDGYQAAVRAYALCGRQGE